KRLANLPRGGEGSSYEARAAAAKKSFDEIDKQAVELNVLIASFAAERVAIEKYFNDTRQAEKPGVGDVFERQVSEVKALEDRLNQACSQLRRDIVDSAQSVGMGDAETQAEEALKQQLASANTRERDLFAQLR